MAEANVITQVPQGDTAAHRIPAPCCMVIYGASGDLTERKLGPALFYLSRAGLLPDGFSVIGCAKTPYTNETFREKMRKAVEKYLKISEEDKPALEAFTRDVHYIADDFGDVKAYEQLKNLLDRLDKERGTCGNRLFYLATPPSFFPVIAEHLGTAGLAA
ncbi:MAG: glucose-6-phosphate dehydrogenase, partial [Acidobacteriota bacterium]|nr:glucose-6-phosphate dehydrogenase [Acidobacteriota bacterium]